MTLCLAQFTNTVFTGKSGNRSCVKRTFSNLLVNLFQLTSKGSCNITGICALLLWQFYGNLPGLLCERGYVFVMIIPWAKSNNTVHRHSSQSLSSRSLRCPQHGP